jgi:hypothetical protein
METASKACSMDWRPFFVIVLAWIPAIAHADCASEAIEARNKILTSGAFHYSTRIWDASFSSYDWKKAGLIEPNKAEHVQETIGNNERSRQYKYREMITIDKQRWEKGDAGWFLPKATLADVVDYDSVVPDLHEEILTPRCLGQVEIEGKSFTGYEFQTKIAWGLQYTVRLFADPGSGLTVRYERHAPGPIFDVTLFDVISTYRYDASIKIEPPKVDVNDFPPPIREQDEVTGRSRSWWGATKF